MVTDIEMCAMQGLSENCNDKISKDILDVAQEMLGALDADGFVSDVAQTEFLEEYVNDINDIVQRAIYNKELKRNIAEYTVLCSFEYGDKEIFLGENPNAKNEIERYIVGDCVSNELFERYENCICGDSYNEIAALYSQRINEQIQKVQDDLAKFPYDRTVIGKESCDSITGVDLAGEIIVIKPEAIKREYVGADRQLCVAKHGNGCSPEARGQKVFCKNIFTGQDVTWHRQDVLGTIKPECIPEWVKERMTDKPIEVLFTFGSWEGYPYQMGYVSITAPSVKEAIAEFRRYWPDKSEDCLNCCDYYYKPESVAEIKEHGNGAGCHKSIDITISPKVASVSNLISKAERSCEKVNKDVVQKSDIEMERE